MEAGGIRADLGYCLGERQHGWLQLHLAAEREECGPLEASRADEAEDVLPDLGAVRIRRQLDILAALRQTSVLRTRRGLAFAPKVVTSGHAEDARIRYSDEYRGGLLVPYATVSCLNDGEDLE